MSTLGLLATATVAVSLVSLIPQLLRVLRTRVTDGLSAATIVLTLVSFTLWGAYGVSVSDPTQIVNNVAGLAVFAVLAHVVAKESQALRAWHGPAVVLVTAAGAAGLAAWASPVAPAAVGTALGFVTKVPQVRVALSGAPLWGLDPWAVLLTFASVLMWLSYGLAAGDAAVVVSSLVGAVLNAVILAYRLPPRRTLQSLAAGRLGPQVARVTAPLSVRFPHTAVA